MELSCVHLAGWFQVRLVYSANGKAVSIYLSSWQSVGVVSGGNCATHTCMSSANQQQLSIRFDGLDATVFQWIGGNQLFFLFFFFLKLSPVNLCDSISFFSFSPPEWLYKLPSVRVTSFQAPLGALCGLTCHHSKHYPPLPTSSEGFFPFFSLVLSWPAVFFCHRTEWKTTEKKNNSKMIKHRREPDWKCFSSENFCLLAAR